MPIALPPAVGRVAALDPSLASELEEAFARLATAAAAMVWAQERLGSLVAASTDAGILGVLVDEARNLTGAPSVWALTWTGDLRRGTASIRALRAAGEAGAEPVPAPGEISRTIVGRVVESGRPAWSDDARADARFLAAESVQGFDLRSVGCLGVGSNGVLYLHDPDTPGRFGMETRLRLTALCGLAGTLLDVGGRRVPRRSRPAVDPVPGLVGSADVMIELYDAIHAFAPMPWPALILGETGTGKERVAVAMHELSPRAKRPFVAVNCGAIPGELAESTLFGHERGAFTGADRRHEGLVTRAGEGTLFLDEVGELPPRLQVKILRLLQDGTYEPVGSQRSLRFSGRVLAATHRPLTDDRDGFRDDLFHRLAACVVHVPALRDRREDVPELAAFLLARSLGELPRAPALTLTPAALRDLQSRPWPGNVRELENALRTAIARAMARRSHVIDVEHLGGGRGGGASAPPDDLVDDLAAATDAFQRQLVRRALAAHDGNRTQAARQLGVSRQWLHRLLARWEDGGDVGGEGDGE